VSFREPGQFRGRQAINFAGNGLARVKRALVTTLVMATPLVVVAVAARPLPGDDAGHGDAAGRGGPARDEEFLELAGRLLAAGECSG
jgi:hypothetical protein